jgi:hypothetical protein
MSTQNVGMTTAAPSFVTNQNVTPEYIRLPPSGEQNSCFGLTRSYINFLILPSKENDFRPPVRSSVLRKSGAKTGVRLVNIASLRAHLKKQLQIAQDQSGALLNAGDCIDFPAPNSHVEFIRLPKTKGRDPLFGLSRSFLNQLILPCAGNNYNPPVRSHVLRRRGYRTGIRLISVDSLRAFIKAHEDLSGAAQPEMSVSGAPPTSGKISNGA